MRQTLSFCRRIVPAVLGCLILAGYCASVLVLFWSWVPFVYAALTTAGAWIIPLVTSYLPHDPHAKDFGYSQQWNFAIQHQFPGQFSGEVALRNLLDVECFIALFINAAFVKLRLF